MHFGCLQIDQKTNEIFLRIFALASNKRSNQKSCVRESKQNPPISGKVLLFFLFDLILKARSEILEKVFVNFLEEVLTPKGHFEIN